MTGYVLPTFYALFAWWFATGLVLLVVGMPRRLRGWIAAAMVAATAGGLAALVLTRNDESLLGAYAGFTAALLVWGAQETAFLAGWVTGPSREACPPGLGGWARAVCATRAILHHELALAACGLAVLGATLGGENLVGPATFLLLFAMRISAKLNVFLGVPNITESFLPAELEHLKSFFVRKPMNLLFPVSVTAATVVAVLCVDAAWSAVDEAAAARATFVSALLILGILEHWFLVLPLPVEALWSWGLRSRPSGDVPEAPHASPQGGAENVIRLSSVKRTGEPASTSRPPVRANELTVDRPEHVWGKP